MNHFDKKEFIEKAGNDAIDESVDEVTLYLPRIKDGIEHNQKYTYCVVYKYLPTCDDIVFFISGIFSLSKMEGNLCNCDYENNDPLYSLVDFIPESVRDIIRYKIDFIIFKKMHDVSYEEIEQELEDEYRQEEYEHSPWEW